jgi:hypothetical protein
MVKRRSLFFIAIHSVSFQYIIMRIANPVTQLGWTANPAQREQQGDAEHLPRRKISDYMQDECTYRKVFHLFSCKPS